MKKNAGWMVGGLIACMACTLTVAAGSTRGALEFAIQRWMTAVNARDADTLALTMTEDVELLDANATTVTGRDAVIRALREAATRGQLAGTSREITIANDVAWHVVWLAQTHKNGDVHALGQALEIWKRVNSEWKLHRQIAAGVIAPGLSRTRPSTREPVLDRPKN